MLLSFVIGIHVTLHFAEGGMMRAPRSTGTYMGAGVLGGVIFVKDRAYLS